MDVKIKLSGVMQKYSTDSQSEFCVLSFKEPVPIKDALAELKIPADLPILILLNGIVKNDEQILKEGDTISVFPTMSGG